MNPWAGRTNHLNRVVDGGWRGGASHSTERLVASDMELNPGTFRINLYSGLGVVRIDHQQRLRTQDPDIHATTGLVRGGPICLTLREVRYAVRAHQTQQPVQGRCFLGITLVRSKPMPA